MLPIEIMLVRSARAIVEVALLALIGQGVLAFLSGAGREHNLVYRLFATVTAPVIRVVRWLTPGPVVDKHVPFVAVLLLFWLWILLAWVKRTLCLMEGLAC